MPLHKAAGYTCIVASLVHAIVYLNAWAQSDTLHAMLEPEQIAGILAGIALVLIGVSTLPYIRRQRYERMLRHSTSAGSCLTNWLYSILCYTRHTVGLHFNSHGIAPARHQQACHYNHTFCGFFVIHGPRHSLFQILLQLHGQPCGVDAATERRYSSHTSPIIEGHSRLACVPVAARYPFCGDTPFHTCFLGPRRVCRELLRWIHVSIAPTCKRFSWEDLEMLAQHRLWDTT